MDDDELISHGMDTSNTVPYSDHKLVFAFRRAIARIVRFIFDLLWSFPHYTGIADDGFLDKMPNTSDNLEGAAERDFHAVTSLSHRHASRRPWELEDLKMLSALLLLTIR